MSEWIVSIPAPSVKWPSVVRAMCEALESDETREFARVGEFAPKSATRQHIAKTLAKFPAYAATFDVAYATNGDEREVAIIRK